MSEAEKPTPSAKIIGSTHQSNLNLPIGVPASPQALGKEAPSGGEGMLSRNSSDSPSPSDRVSLKPTPSVREAIKDAERLFTCGSLAHGHVSTLSYLNPDMEPQKITSPATDLEAPRFPVSEKRAILMQKFGEEATYEQFVAFLGKQIA